MSKLLKRRMAQELCKNLREVHSFVLFGYHKMHAQQTFLLRKHLRSQNIFVRIVKNKIAAIAFSERYKNSIAELLEGPTAIAYGGGSPAEVAKALLEWNKKEKILDIKGGFLANRPLSRQDIEKLAKVPPKPVILSMLAGAFLSPLTQMAGIIKAPVRDFACAFQALIEKKEKEVVNTNTP